jgi:hypothetical protein
MIDIHPPQHGAMTRRDIITHIAIVVLGIFIAIGLEQTIEVVHHLHQRRELESNLRTELRLDLLYDAADYRILANVRAYTVELKSAVSARRAGNPSPPAPPAAADTRRNQVPIAPSMAIWDTAKLDATITLLPTNQIEMYHRAVLQHDLLFNAIDDFQHAAFTLESFEERFVDSPGAFEMGYPAPSPNLTVMSPADLTQYEGLLAAYIKSVDRMVVRIHFFDSVDRAILDGVTDHDDLNRRVFPGGKPPDITPPPDPTRSTHP